MGDKLPVERELVEEYNTSRTVVNAALAELAQKGFGGQIIRSRIICLFFLSKGHCMKSIVKMKNVAYSYPNSEEQTLKQIDFEAPQGKFTVVMGKTGAGKTTSLLCLNGIIPQLHEGDLTGDIEVAGLDVSKYRIQTLSKYLGIVMQDTATQVFGSTVEEDIAFGPRNYLVPREEIYRRIQIV